MKIKVSYLKWRAGRPRWEPGPTLRDKGWKGRDLRNEVGEWLDMARAIEAARRLNDEVTAWRAGGEKKRRAPTPLRPPRTGDHLWEVWRTSPKFTKKAETTKADYRRKISVFLADFGETPVASIEKSHLYRWWEEMHATRGHHMANGVLAVVLAMLSHASRIGWRADNPARELGLDTAPPRLVFWLPEEVTAVVGAADSLGLHSVGDAIIIALHSGQRLSDVLALPDRIFDEQRIRLSQAKMRSRGGALIDAPMTPALRDRVTAIKARKRQAGLTRIDVLILREDNGDPYDKFSLNKAFRQARDLAAKTSPCVADKRFQDLRDTAVTRLALAGCELAEIAAITGHSLISITSIIRHYLVLQPEMADSAIKKLSAWLSAQEIAL
ncbi:MULTISPECIES: tyrosine-type recombinase/integrase [Rhodomicrobium]|uniref:tyrosine-type recombinase/integrase n=1 Tax=Rhodomicrobium TaxID=1068 RepID=UPI000B4B5CCE|nr:MULTISPECIES: tyrosine-type recombinase/integrase [Rhodomicrobium]